MACAMRFISVNTPGGDKAARACPTCMAITLLNSNAIHLVTQFSFVINNKATYLQAEHIQKFISSRNTQIDR